ncbi:meiotic recombination protein SPO11 [Hydra vulgaris]|uniref:DNA topoisomerase (ATP-hydrolyzing) n=1 Tax=Hydra vulgaris TaxID=6087 RepID=A0ABM4CHP7_HYDVU
MAKCRPKEDFWCKVNELTQELVSLKKVSLLGIETIPTNRQIFSLNYLSKEEILEKIENLIKDFLIDIANNSLPKFSINKRGGNFNTDYLKDSGFRMIDVVEASDVSLSHLSSLRKYTIMMVCLCHCYKLILMGKHSTKRDIYYSNVNLFVCQGYVDDCLANISCMLGIPRNSLNVLSSAKGLIYGCLKYTNQNNFTVNCYDQVTQIPSEIESIQIIQITARYILVIEKEAIFQRLAEHGFQEKLGHSLIITGKGFPDVNTRMLLNKICKHVSIPVFALVDADPHGIEIMFVYKFGSKSMSYEAEHLTCPSMKWLGILPKDIIGMRVPNRVLIPLSQNDNKKLLDLMNRPYVLQNKDYKEQINFLHESGLKAEIECLDSISHTYITDIYLPLKLRNGVWI